MFDDFCNWKNSGILQKVPSIFALLKSYNISLINFKNVQSSGIVASILNRTLSKIAYTFVEGESESNQLTERNSGFAAAATKVHKSTHGDGERKRKVKIKG